VFRLKRRFAGSLALLVFGLGFGWPAFGQGSLADPTRPPVLVPGSATGAVQKTMKWKLTSTLIGPQRRVAVINGRAVRLGGNIDGAVLVAVEPGRASLRYGGRMVQVELMTGAVKRAAEPAN
jgi:MSHA biogenesis protein MshK